MAIDNYIAVTTNWSKSKGVSQIDFNNMNKSIKNNRAKLAADGTTSGTGSAYTLSSITDLDEYIEGLAIVVKVHANSLANATINLNSLGPKSILLNDNITAISADDLISNRKYIMVFDATLDAFVIPYPLTGGGSAAPTVAPITHTDEALTFNEENIEIDFNGLYVNNNKLMLGNNKFGPVEDATLTFEHLIEATITAAHDIRFNGDGSKVFILDGVTNNKILQFTLFTPYNLKSIRYDAVTLSLNTTNISQAMAMEFNLDGTKLFIGGGTSAGVESYTLSTPWEITSATPDGNFQLMDYWHSSITAIFFKPDGKTMYLGSPSMDWVAPYELKTAWDVSTLGLDIIRVLDVSVQEADIDGIFITPDGKRMLISGSSSENIHSYSLGIPWEPWSASVDGTGLNMDTITTVNSNTRGLTLSPDLQKIFVVNSGENKIFEFDVFDDDKTLLNGFAYVNINESEKIYSWDIASHQKTLANGTATVDIQESSVGIGPLNTWTLKSERILGSIFSQEDILITDSGTKYYVFSYGNIYQYDLLTPYDLQTKKYKGFRNLRELKYPNGDLYTAGIDGSVFIDPSGSKLFAADIYNSQIVEFDIQTPWDISTLELNRTYDLSTTVASSPKSLEFSDNGLTLFILDGNFIYEFSLTVAYDIDTATYTTNSLDISAATINSIKIKLKNGGTKLYLVSNDDNTIDEYTLSIANSITSATLTNTLDTTLFGTVNTMTCDLSTDGTKLYVFDTPNYGPGYDGVVRQCTLSTAWSLPTYTYNYVVRATEELEELSAFSFNSDGTELYVIDTQYRLAKYTLSVPYTIDTLDFVVKLDISTQFTAQPIDLTVNPAGELIFLEYNNDILRKLVLNTPGDITSGFASNTTFDMTSILVNVGLGSAIFKPDGTKLYVNNGGWAVEQFSLGTAWDIQTITADTISGSFSSLSEYINGNTAAIALSQDGKYLFGTDSSSGFETSIYALYLNTPWNLSSVVSVSKLYQKQTIVEGVYNNMFINPLNTELCFIGDEIIRTLDIAGIDWTTVANDISRNADISSIPSYKSIRFKVSLSRTVTTDNPTVDYLAQRYER